MRVKKIDSYYLREGTGAWANGRSGERVRAGCTRTPLSRTEIGTDSVGSKLPPLHVPMSPSLVSREASRDLWRSIGSSMMVVFKLRTSQ